MTEEWRFEIMPRFEQEDRKTGRASPGGKQLDQYSLQMDEVYVCISTLNAASRTTRN